MLEIWTMTVWKLATFVFAILAIASPIVIEVLRWVVRRRRERVSRFVSTQDIAMWGSFIGLFFLAATLVSAFFWSICS
jgi:hypothetical protein